MSSTTCGSLFWPSPQIGSLGLGVLPCEMVYVQERRRLLFLLHSGAGKEEQHNVSTGGPSHNQVTCLFLALNRSFSRSLFSLENEVSVVSASHQLRLFPLNAAIVSPSLTPSWPVLLKIWKTQDPLTPNFPSLECSLHWEQL